MREIIRASAWRGFAEVVTSLGGNPTRILAEAQIDEKSLEDGERYLPLRQFILCQAIAAERLKRRDFGLLFGQQQALAVLGALSIAIINSTTARRGIEIAAKFMHVHNPALAMTLAPMPRSKAEFLACDLRLRDGSRREQNDERILSNLHKSLGQLGGASYKPHAVWIMHAPMAPMNAYRRVFGIDPVFNQPTMGIAIERDLLDSWRPGGSEQMRAVAEAYLTQQTSESPLSYTRSVASMARSLLRGGEFTPAQTAKALGLHQRTLQRRLREEGSSFEKIKDDARREWAQSLLGQPSVALSEIALMLGYADASAFSRSCRRWFGVAPRTFRARMKSGRPAPPAPRISRVNSLEATLRAKRRTGI